MIYMNQKFLKYLNANDFLRQNLPQLTAIFTKYYGEEARDEISQSFQNALFIAYMSPESIKRILNKLEQELTFELLKDILDNQSIPLNFEDLFKNYSLANYQIMPIFQYIKLYEMYTMGKEKREKEFFQYGYEQFQKAFPEISRAEYDRLVKENKISEFLARCPRWLKETVNYYLEPSNCQKKYISAFNEVKELCQKIDPTINSENIEDKLGTEPFIKLVPLIQKFKNKTEKFTDSLKPFETYYQYIEQSTSLFHDLSERCFKEFVSENINLISSENRQEVEEYIKDSRAYYTLNKKTKDIFGSTLWSSTILDSFQEENEEALQMDSWKAESIKKERIAYFKQKGLDLGEDYETYISSKEAQKIWPLADVVSKFFASRKKYRNKLNQAYFNSLIPNQKVRAEIDALGLLDKEDNFDANLYQQGGTSVNPNIRQTSHGYEIFSLLLLGNLNQFQEHIDHDIIHELNHLYELHLLDVKEDKYTMLCGWDILTSNINQTQKEEVDTNKVFEEKRPYELFNEIINELITQEICSIMAKEQLFVFDEDKTFKYQHTTSYEKSLPFVKTFFEEFKEPILASRRKGNIQLIFDTVGRENFEALNEIVNTFYENFPDFKYYDLIRLLSENKDTKETRLYYNLLNQKEKVLEHMRKHNRQVQKR